MMVRVSKDQKGWSARKLWRSNRLRNTNGPTIYRDGFLYGFAGDILVCVNADPQEITWRERTGPGTLIAVEQAVMMAVKISVPWFSGTDLCASFAWKVAWQPGMA
jgi:hypothetical protein